MVDDGGNERLEKGQQIDRQEYGAFYERDRHLRDEYDQVLETDSEGLDPAAIIALTELPEEVKTERGLRLQNKLMEYTRRIADYKKNNPYASPEQIAQKGYKRDVLRLILENGSVNSDALFRAIRTMDGGVDEWRFQNACGVIGDYIKTGGADVIQGTGLPSADRSE